MAVRRFPMDHIRQRELDETARRLELEQTTAPKIVEAILRKTPREAWKTLVERPELLSMGAIDHLAGIVARQTSRDPKYAEAVAKVAMSIAEALPPGSYPPVLIAQAKAESRKDYGKVLAALSRHGEAVQAFEDAERHLDPFLTLAYDRAIIRLNLAITYQDMGRYGEALPIIEECKSVFRDHNATTLAVLAGFYEGLNQQRLANYREARETYLLLIASCASIPKHILAALHQTIGLCSIELHDLDAAEDNLAKAIELHTQLGESLHVVKGDHGRGMLLLRRGQTRGGLTVLRQVRHQYLKHSLAEEAGLCGLEMVEALLTLDEPERAERLARTILSEFLAAALNTRAITALGYLTEAIAARTASPKTATQVYDFVLSLRTTPEREFTPQPLLTRGEE